MPPLNALLSDTQRAISASSPSIIDSPAPSSVISSSSSEKKLPQIYINRIEGEMPAPRGPSEVGLRGQWPAARLGAGSVPGESTSIRRSLPSEAERYNPPSHQAPRPAPHFNSHLDRGSTQHAGAQQEPGRGSDQRPSPSHSSTLASSSDAGFSSSDHLLPGSSTTSAWNSSSGGLQAKAGVLFSLTLSFLLVFHSFTLVSVRKDFSCQAFCSTLKNSRRRRSCSLLSYSRLM